MRGSAFLRLHPEAPAAAGSAGRRANDALVVSAASSARAGTAAATASEALYQSGQLLPSPRSCASCCEEREPGFDTVDVLGRGHTCSHRRSFAPNPCTRETSVPPPPPADTPRNPPGREQVKQPYCGPAVHSDVVAANTNTNANTKYTCDTGQTRNKLLAQWQITQRGAATKLLVFETSWLAEQREGLRPAGNGAARRPARAQGVRVFRLIGTCAHTAALPRYCYCDMG